MSKIKGLRVVKKANSLEKENESKNESTISNILEQCDLSFSSSFTIAQKKQIASYLALLGANTKKSIRRNTNQNNLIEVLLPNGLIHTDFYLSEIA